MLKNYLLIGWRNLWKDKGYSLINIGGLAMGIAFAMVIGLWIIRELRFDSFHVNGNNIALIKKHTRFNDQRSTQDATPYPLADELKNNYPEVKRATRMTYEFEVSLTAENKTITETGRFVETDFLQMFSFPLLAGNAKALNDPNAIVLTESLALSLFGEKAPLGKTVRLGNRDDLRVTAIVKDVPSNSTLNFSFLCAYERLASNDPFIDNNRTSWGNNFLITLVEMNEGVSMDAFSNKIRDLNMEKDNTIKDQTLSLHPLNKWHLYNDFENWQNVGGKIEYVRLFGVIGVFVLLIACINFMNLSTARSQRRAKEVGIRKTMGSQRGQLILQFLSESVLTVLLSFLFAVCLLTFSFPYLHEVGLEDLQLNPDNASVLILGLAICIGAGLVAGSYPALYLSSFSPSKVLKGLFKQGKSPITFRRTLVVVQFTISVALITSTVIVFQQIRHAKARPVGYDPDNLISIRATDDLQKNFEVMKHELLSSGHVEAVASASSPLTAVYNKWSDFSWEGKDPNTQIALEALMTGWDLEKVADLKFKMGRPFSLKYASDSNAVILNEAALAVIGYHDPIGKTMKSGAREVVIVGVIENMVMLDPFSPVSPGVILFNAGAVNTVLIRVKQDAEIKNVLPALQQVLQKHNAGQPVSYSFVDEDFNKKFHLEEQVGKLAGIFAVLAMAISALGLIGLASFIAEQRLKEIGIRKILGASVSRLWTMLSKDFLTLVLISCIIASAFAWYFMSNWLLKYEYRTEVSWWVFVLTSVAALTVTLLTISYQAVKVALVNPVQTLKSE